MAKIEYPLDTTGSAATNLTAAELHSVTYNADADFHFIIPDYAPLYKRGFQMSRRVGTNRIPLVDGMDFHFGLNYETAAMALGMPVVGAIVLTNMDETSTYEIHPYQTVGGEHVLSENQIAVIIANMVYNPQALTWEQVQDKPKIFPPVQHPWKFSDMVGQSQVVETIQGLSNTIAAKATPGGDHPFIKGNVHGVSKFDLDLGLVPNFPLADLNKMISGEDNRSLVSPALVFAMLRELGLLDVSAQILDFEKHLKDMNNPHETDKALTGLALVENKATASSEDIARNLDADKYLTLAGLKQWFAMHGNMYNDKVKEPIPQGALLSSWCNASFARMGTYADGKGGTYDSIITVNDTTCGYQSTVPIAHPPKGEILNQYCSGPNLMSIVADGYGGSSSTLQEVNSPRCVTGDFKPKGTVLGSVCEGTTLVRTIADGAGGTTIERVENSSQCLVNTHPPKGTLLKLKCTGFTQMGEYADGNGGFYDGVLETNSKDCGWVPPVVPPEQTHPPAQTILGTRCDGYTLYYIYANGSGGQYELVNQQNSPTCGYVPPKPTSTPAPGPSPTPAPTPAPSDRIGRLRFSTTLTMIYIGDTEVQTTTMEGWTPNKSYTLEIWGSSVAWGLPYDRMLDTFRIDCDASGNGSYRRTINEVGIVPVGRYQSWMAEPKSGVTSNTIERRFMGGR